jgi:hypothetical protein
MRKGFVNILELIFVLIALFIAFGILFPGASYVNKWSQALLIANSRDIILTADRMGKLYDYSFDASQLSGFLNQVIPITRTNLLAWSQIEGTIKSRVIVACNCTEQQKDDLTSWISGITFNGRTVDIDFVRTNLDEINMPSDVLLIFGYRDITPVQDEIFGITEGGTWGSPTYGGTWGSPTYDEIIKPATASNITYQAYKIYLKALGGQSPISPEFCKDTSNKRIVPSDNDASRIFVKANDGSPCVIFNDKKVAKVAWIAGPVDPYNSNHTKLLASVLLSASNKRAIGILSPNLQVGYMTSYINVKNNDMFEIYRFNLGLGHPY